MTVLGLMDAGARQSHFDLVSIGTSRRMGELITLTMKEVG